MNILGISDVTGNHSHSCVALLQDGELRFALSQERLSRIKNDPRFPEEALEEVLSWANLTLQDIDLFACGYPPAHYYASLMANSFWDMPRSVAGVLVRKPEQLFKYLFPNIKKGLFDPKNTNGLFERGVPPEKFRFVDHHLAHVSAGYFSSDFDDALAISYGGFAPHISGRNVAGAVYQCKGDQITFCEDIPMPAAGCWYSGITVALGFAYMQQEGKTMGLAALGDPGLCYDEIRSLTTTFENGSWQPYSHWIDYIMTPRRNAFLGTRSGQRLRRLLDHYRPEDLAAAAQRIWEENIVAFVSYLLEKYPARSLVLSGGTFLNVQINKKLAELEHVDRIFAHPHTGDGSTTIGAMIEAHRQQTGSPPRVNTRDTGLGVEFDDHAIEKTISIFSDRISYKKLNESPGRYAASRLAEYKIVGWFQGREEYGPRALGHRCILGHPKSWVIHNRINKFVKRRETWVPIAPSCLAEHGSEYFIDFENNPFMTRVYSIRAERKNVLPAVLHRNYTARAQSVDKSFFRPFRELLEHFYELTSSPMVLNTSFNVHNQPIVHEPAEAIKILLDTPMDELVIENFVVRKTEEND